MQVVFTNPMEIVKVRLQTQKEGASKKALWTIVKELGVKGLYDGAGVTLARDVPSSAIFFAIYTLIRGVYPDQSFLAGSIAAIPATILVTPMDIIKTRLQVCSFYMVYFSGYLPALMAYGLVVMRRNYVLSTLKLRSVSYGKSTREWS